MSESHFKDYFSTQSAAYARYRPGYPDALVDALADACCRCDTAVDCGCGAGQLSVLLARRFARVIALDASRNQIENAKPCPGVEYRVATAENTRLPDASVDLIAAAQAAHWLDLERFYAEAERIAKPGATLALIAYGLMRIDADEDLNASIRDFYDGVLGDYWPAERRQVETGYRELRFPFRELGFPPLSMAAQWDLAQLMGYIRTWSAVKALETCQGTAPIERFQDGLASLWGDARVKKPVRWPLSVRIGRIA